MKWDGDDWDHFRRFNFGLKLVLGYAIPIGPVSLVPGFCWSMHLINEYKDIPDEEEATQVGGSRISYYDQARAINFMFRVAGEFGF
jgi:hypothetical protein